MLLGIILAVITCSKIETTDRFAEYLQEEKKIRVKRKSMEKIFCHNCKTENSYNNVYCQQCGAPITEKSKYNAWKEAKDMKKQMAVLISQVSELSDLKNELKKRKN